MKKLTIVALAALMLLTTVLDASAAIQATEVEVRGAVWNDSTDGTVPALKYWDPATFAGFYYDIKDNLGTEKLELLEYALCGAVNTSVANCTGENRKINKGNLVYSTTAQAKSLKLLTGTGLTGNDNLTAAGLEQASSGKAFDGGKYWIIGWQAEKYVAVAGKPEKLAKLMVEHGTSASEKKTLTVGETWEIGDGWTLTANSIDAKASPRQVWLTLSKDGVKKDDKVVTAGTRESKPIYTYVEKSLCNENDVPMFVTYVDSVFAGATTDMVQLRYTWLISSTCTQIKGDDTYGKFKNAVTNGKQISLKSDVDITLNKDSTIDLMGNMKFKVADSETLRFYPMVIRNQPGTYEVRGSVWNDSTDGIIPALKEWTPLTFAGFFYDIKDNLGTEKLELLEYALCGAVNSSVANCTSENRKINKGNLVYSTTAQAKALKLVTGTGLTGNDNLTAAGLEQASSGKAFDGGQYWIIGWQAEKYVAVAGKPEKLAKLMVEHGTSASEKKTLTVGETWEIGDGWTLTANSIDAKASPRQVWLTLSKDGVKKDDKVVTAGTKESKPIYTYVEKSLCNENDVPMFVTYVDSVFAGATTDMVQLRYTWLISSTCTQIKGDDTYGKFKNAVTSGKQISLKSDVDITLNKDTTIDLMGNMKFKVADSDTLRFYPFVEYEISGGEGTGTTGGTPSGTVTATVSKTTNATAAATTAVVSETTAVATTAATPVATPKKTEPGFEAVFAIAGLLAVAFLVLRQRK